MNELLSLFLNLLANLGPIFTKKSLIVFAICSGSFIVVSFILRLLMVVCLFFFANDVSLGFPWADTIVTMLFLLGFGNILFEHF